MLLARVVKCVSDRARGDSRHGDDIAGKCFLQVDVDHPEPFLYPCHLRLCFNLPVLPDSHYLVAHREGARGYPANQHLAEVLIRLGLRDEHLEVTFRVQVGLGYRFNDSVKQVFHVVALFTVH